jgi:hypothetical protein
LEDSIGDAHYLEAQTETLVEQALGCMMVSSSQNEGQSRRVPSAVEDPEGHLLFSARAQKSTLFPSYRPQQILEIQVIPWAWGKTRKEKRA